MTRIAAAGIAGLVLQQVSVLLINYSAQRMLDPGALTHDTWANAIYLLPYAVLAAPLLQLAFPRLAAAADIDIGEVRRVIREFLPLVTISAWLGTALLVATAVPVARVFVLGPGRGGYGGTGLADRTVRPRRGRFRAAGPGFADPAGPAPGSRRRRGDDRGWGAVIIGVLIFGRTVPLLAVAMSAGLSVGAVVGWILVRRSAAIALGRPAGADDADRTARGGVGGRGAVWPGRQLAELACRRPPPARSGSRCSAR